MTLYLPIAPPGAGKSYLADLMVQAGMLDADAVVCPDVYRRLLTGDTGNQDRNDAVFSIVQRIVESRLFHGLDVYLDATNLGRTLRQWRKRSDALNTDTKVEIVVIEFDIDEDVVRSQNANRDRVVPDFVMDNMISKWWADSQVEAINACADRVEDSTDVQVRAEIIIEQENRPVMDPVILGTCEIVPPEYDSSRRVDPTKALNRIVVSDAVALERVHGVLLREQVEIIQVDWANFTALAGKLTHDAEISLGMLDAEVTPLKRDLADAHWDEHTSWRDVKAEDWAAGRGIHGSPRD